MITRLRYALFQNRDGQLVLAASFVYLVIGLLAKFVPSVAPIQGFYGWFALFMPFPLFLLFLQCGGFKRDFRPTAFSTGVLVIVALMPVIVKVKTLMGV
ncbi:hypothetical protein SAMN05216350_10168 [Polaromonas sp. YR568]|uniref:hypothetical protein n=1 Tax=Polaromonas sp. YR568 TaxID=1855301 RepID=UPI0008F40CD1|nr:hypothetical protein [Polaromonas sp. YR568]SFU28258.1 hypothetical protein SAMN05216350_10168 [Polaromonas sp. YR568]